MTHFENLPAEPHPYSYVGVPFGHGQDTQICTPYPGLFDKEADFWGARAETAYTLGQSVLGQTCEVVHNSLRLVEIHHPQELDVRNDASVVWFLNAATSLAIARLARRVFDATTAHQDGQAYLDFSPSTPDLSGYYLTKEYLNQLGIQTPRPSETTWYRSDDLLLEVKDMPTPSVSFADATYDQTGKAFVTTDKIGLKPRVSRGLWLTGQ